MQPIPYHRYANIIPIASDEDFDGICQNMRQHGFAERNAIVLFENQILDGRTRARACEATNTQPVYRKFDPATEGDPLDFVLQENLHRRHLTESQRAMVAAEAATLTHGGDRTSSESKTQDCGLLGISVEKAAESFAVSPRLVTSARKVKDRGVSELNAAVKDGTITVSAAAPIAALPQDEQPAALKAAVSKAEPAERSRVAKVRQPPHGNVKVKPEFTPEKAGRRIRMVLKFLPPETQVPLLLKLAKELRPEANIATETALWNAINELGEISQKQSMLLTNSELQKVAAKIRIGARPYLGIEAAENTGAA